MTLAPRLPSELEVRNVDGRGRALFAKTHKAYKAGSKIASLEPHAVVLAKSCLTTHCTFCTRQAGFQPDTNEQATLLRCSGCRVARFCDAECARKAWTAGEHKEECKALQRLKASGAVSDNPDFGNCAVPDTPVRALARLLWRKGLHDAAWWSDVQGLQSHRSAMSEEAMRDMGSLAQHLALFVGPEVLRNLPSAGALLDLCCSFASNSFALTSFDLSNIGVCLCPAAAMSNHDCSPNAVVVFPAERRSLLHLVALRDIQPGEEILTSYVDLSLPRRLRQKELRARYYFDCKCRTCTSGPKPDPRKSVKCLQQGCPLISDVPPLCHGEPAKSTCSAGHETVMPFPLVDAIMAIKLDALDTTPTDQLQAQQKLLERYLPDASHPLFAILRLLQDRALSDGEHALALSLAARVAGAMDKLYAVGHPTRAVQLATLGKLLLNSEQGPTREAVFVLRRALGELEVGFGGAGAAVEQVRGMLAESEAFVRARGAM